MIKGYGVGVAFAALLLAAPATAMGSTASTREGGFSASIEFKAAPGEANDVTVTERRDGRLVAFADAGSAIEPGRGCRGGGRRGAPVLCRPPDASPSGIPADLLPNFLVLRARLGDDDDHYDSTALPRKLDEAPGGRADLETKVDAGDGADSLESGATNDTVTAGPGDDAAIAGRGSDTFRAGRASDGTDLVDGGGARDFAEYDRADAVSLTLDGLANDGARGEADRLVSIEALGGGDADDLLVGNEEDNDIVAGGGSDAVGGLGGDDDVLADIPFAFGGESLAEARAAAGDDLVAGGDGDDQLIGGFGEDQLAGGPGADGIDSELGLILSIFDAESEPDRATDQVDCGPGPDETISERRDALVSCETEVEYLDDGDRSDLRAQRRGVAGR